MSKKSPANASVSPSSNGGGNHQEPQSSESREHVPMWPGLWLVPQQLLPDHPAQINVESTAMAGAGKAQRTHAAH